jgi:hypothetical protein
MPHGVADCNVVWVTGDAFTIKADEVSGVKVAHSAMDVRHHYFLRVVLVPATHQHSENHNRGMSWKWRGGVVLSGQSPTISCPLHP